MKQLLFILLTSVTFLSQPLLAKDKEIRVPVESVKTKVNINKANAAQMASMLKGVGLKKAQAIIDYRTQYGEFSSIDELTAVKGIGEKTVQKNRSKIAI